jgi:hypothetical protein
MHTYTRTTGTVTVRIHVNQDWSGGAIVTIEETFADAKPGDPPRRSGEIPIPAIDLVNGVISEDKIGVWGGQLQAYEWCLAVSLASSLHTALTLDAPREHRSQPCAR